MNTVYDFLTELALDPAAQIRFEAGDPMGSLPAEQLQLLQRGDRQEIALALARELPAAALQAVQTGSGAVENGPDPTPDPEPIPDPYDDDF